MHWLQTITHVRQRARHDNGHGIVEITRLHLVNDADGGDVGRVCDNRFVGAQKTDFRDV